MEKFQKFDRNYFYHLVSFFVFFIFLSLIGVTLLNRLFFATSYFWHTLLAHPNIKSRVESRRYRYSFIKFIYNIDFYLHDKLVKNTNNRFSKLVRGAQPFVLILLIATFSGMGNPFFSIIGSVIYEGLIIGFKKIPPHWPPDQLD